MRGKFSHIFHNPCGARIFQHFNAQLGIGCLNGNINGADAQMNQPVNFLIAEICECDIVSLEK